MKGLFIKEKSFVCLFDFELIHFFVLLFGTQMLVFLPGFFWFYVDMMLVKVDLLQSGYFANYLFLKNQMKVGFIFFDFELIHFFVLLFDIQMLVFLYGIFWFCVDMMLVKVYLLQSGYSTNYLFLKNQMKVCLIFLILNWFIFSFCCLILKC